MSLQDKLDALKARFETEMAPPEVVAVMHRVTDELTASGQADRALKAGDRAPRSLCLMRKADKYRRRTC
jgi:hypothetical protein